MWQKVVREWLIQNDRSQAWLARRADISESYFSFVLNGLRTVSNAYLTRLEIVMELPPETLVWLKGQSFRSGRAKGEPCQGSLES